MDKAEGEASDKGYGWKELERAILAILAISTAYLLGYYGKYNHIPNGKDLSRQTRVRPMPEQLQPIPSVFLLYKCKYLQTNICLRRAYST